MSDIVVGLDIGTSNVRVVIGEHDENEKLHIIGVGTAPSTGLRSGVIVNIEATMKAVTAAIYDAELMSGHEVNSCFVGIGSTQVDVRHELKAMGNTGRRIFSVVRNKQQLRFTFANQHINKTADKLAIERIKPL